MKLIIGGLAQGKLNYVLQNEVNENRMILDGTFPSSQQMEEAKRNKSTVIIHHFHRLVRQELLAGHDVEKTVTERMMELAGAYQDVTVICDEIGNGIVPVDAFERDYREQTGRILIRLAKEADEVVRVLCGIGQKIK